ncbi:MAG: S24/S26 family peptidase [Elusimicrobia bacterium]|nr:S24/S26 family peptidase [Elusimicrobiota bacterium]
MSQGGGQPSPIFFRLQGGCMRPLIKDGTVLAIRPAPASALRPGDLALYDVWGKRMLHRVWWTKPGKVWLKDDTGTVALHKIPDRKVLGVLQSPGPLSSGWTGLAYGLAATALFSMGRRLKQGFTTRLKRKS